MNSINFLRGVDEISQRSDAKQPMESGTPSNGNAKKYVLDAKNKKLLPHQYMTWQTVAKVVKYNPIFLDPCMIQYYFIIHFPILKMVIGNRVFNVQTITEIKNTK